MLAYKQIPVKEHVTPTLSEQALRNSKIRAVMSAYGHLFSVCRYCGHYHHTHHVCSCGVDTGYLEDAHGKTVYPLVEVFEVPVKEHAG